jgi:3-hydroxyisobutyrate dehydrogenase-like beta-hydroxyacid dehydrogenase
MRNVTHKIGFIGLGNMGSGMASNLLAWCQLQGCELWVLDLNFAVVDQFVAKGAIKANSVSELASAVSVLFTSLPSSKEIGLLSADILDSLPDDAVWFETSTNELAEWEQIKSRARASLILIDAPVTGGSEGAAAGTLTMLLGIDESVLTRHAQMLAAMTSKAVRMGPSGAGYVSKLCQLHLNYLVAQGIGEALMLGAKAELDMPVLLGALQSSCAQSYVVDNYIPKILDGSYDPSFTLGLAQKDMRLVTQLGQHLKVPLRLADDVYTSYQQATNKYGAEQPHLKIVKLIEDETGRLLR